MKKTPLRILCIDDDLGCRLAAARFLTLVGGHMVEAAENGREGLKKAAELRPDLILLDMIMPDMNGLEVMQELCRGAATRDIPVIIITGASLSKAEYACLEANSNFRFLEQKPVNFEKLLETIGAALRSDIPGPETCEIFPEGTPEPA